jgi:Ras-related C3 botulinum toxin substrate 1
MAQPQFKREAKIVVVGDGAVGKTAALLAYSTGKPLGDYVPTVFDNYSTDVSINGQPLTLSLWDTAGQEEYDRLRPLSYSATDVFVICYSSVSATSYENVSAKWFPELKHFCPNVPIVLVSTKNDLVEDPVALARLRAKGVAPVTTLQGEQLAKAIGATAFVETSSKSGKGLKAAFDAAIRAHLTSIGVRTKKSKRSRVCNLL